MTDYKLPKGSTTDWAWIPRRDHSDYTFQIASGMSASAVANMCAGLIGYDFHLDKIGVSLKNPPGSGKTVTVTVSNGTATMTVEITGDTAVGACSTTNHFDYNSSEEDLEVAVTTTSGTTVGTCTVFLAYTHIYDLVDPE